MKLKQLQHAFEVLVHGIEQMGVECEGLYRISGVQSHVVELSSKLLSPRTKRREMEKIIAEQTNIHVLAAALKQLLREMSPPLFPETAYEQLKDASKKLQTETERIESIAQIFSSLPEDRRALIAIVRNHLVTVSSAHENNRMTLKNLVLMFGPNIMRSGKMDALEAMQDQSVQREVSTILLGNNKAINVVFGEPPEYAAINSIDGLTAAQTELLDDSAAAVEPPNSVERSMRLSAYPKGPNQKKSSTSPSKLGNRSKSPPRIDGKFTNDEEVAVSDDHNAAAVSKAQAQLAAIPDKIDEDEVLKSLPAVPPMELPMDIQPDNAFTMFDSDGDGKITFEELLQILRCLGDVSDASELRDMFQSTDIDNDGMISHAEFSKCFTRGRTLLKPHAEDVRTSLGFFDKGGKGVLTRDELMYLCRTYGGNGDVFAHEDVQQLLDALDIDSTQNGLNHQTLAEAIITAIGT
eukprot:m.473897 g.473897  ORF g.473897 m.473897 type:complete len:465 (-) comp21669_c1_seq1:156-1550(-)